MSRRRFINIDYNLQLDSCQTLLTKYLKIENDRDLSGYLLRVLKFRAKNKPSKMSESEKKGADFVALMKSYSRVKFSNIHKNQYFKHLFCYIYNENLPQGNKKWLDILFDQESKNISKHKEKYVKAFNKMYRLCSQNE